MTGSLKLIVAFIVVLVGRGLFAADNDTQAAAEHFKKGVSLFNENKKEAAVKEFKTAFELKPSWKIMYNIGQCEASLKRYGMAIEAFEQYLGEGGDEVTVERRDEVLKELDRLRKMVGSVRIQGPAGYDIVIDSIKRGKTPVSSSILVTAGVEHRISVVKDGETILDVAEKVNGGEILELSAEESEDAPVSQATESAPSQPAPETQPAQPADSSGTPTDKAATDQKPHTAEGAVAPPPRRKPFRPVLFFIGAGATVLFGGAAGGLAVAINKKWEKSEDKIYDDPWTVDAGAVSDNIHTMQIISWITLGLAGAGAILTAVALPLTDWGGNASDSTALTVTPFGGPKGGGMSFGGRF